MSLKCRAESPPINLLVIANLAFPDMSVDVGVSDMPGSIHSQSVPPPLLVTNRYDNVIHVLYDACQDLYRDMFYV